MNDNWGTPSWLKKIFEDWYDPNPLNNGELRQFDALGSWKDKTYINPPYSKPLPWVENGIKESRKGKTIVMLMKVDPSTKWYRKLVEAKAHFLWFAERLEYGDCGKKPNFPSMLVILEGIK
jgi:hypothetical protein